MAVSALYASSLVASGGRLQLAIALPWIRSMPLWCVTDLSVIVDDSPVQLVVRVGEHYLPPAALANEQGWWFLQDRLTLILDRESQLQAHAVTVSFALLVPYLPAGRDAPLSLPFTATRQLWPHVVG